MTRARSPLLRVRVRLHRLELDHRLADGAEPDSRPELALRAAQLTSRRTRLAVADALDRVLAAADHPRRALSPEAPIARAEVDDAHRALAAISERLRSRAPVRAQGVVMARHLVVDIDSPTYAPHEPHELKQAAQAITGSLGTGD